MEERLQDHVEGHTAMDKERINTTDEMKLRKALKKAIEAADEDYRKNQCDSYFSHHYINKKKRLEQILSQEEKHADIGLLLSELRQERQRLMDLVKQEEAHPTFDWSGDHYWEIVYAGKISGCEEAIEILESLLEHA